MEKDNETVIALATSCPTANMRTDDEIKRAMDNLSDKMRKYAHSHPEIVKKYRDSYRVLANFPREQA